MIKNNNRLIVILFVTIFFFGNIASGIAASEEKVLLGLSFATLESEFWQALKNVTIERAKELGAETTTVSADHDIAKQISQIEDLMVKGVSAIIINAVDSEAIVPALNSAMEKGISIVAIDRRISERAKIDCYVGTDNVLAGIMAARVLAERIQGKGKVAILNGPPETLVARDRNEGFLKGLSEYPDIEIITQKWGTSDRVVNMKLMEDIITTFQEVDGVLGFSDFNSLGAADAVISLGLQGKIFIGSIDGIEEVATLMLQENFPIIVSVAQDPNMMARYSALVAYEAATGNRVPITISTWIKEITPENAKEYLESFK